MMRVRRPNTWWGWTFHLARLAVIASGLEGEHKAKWVEYLDRRAQQCFGFAERGLEFGAADVEAADPADDLLVRLVRKPMSRLHLFAAGDGWHLIDLVDSGRAIVVRVDDDKVAQVTRAGRARAASLGVVGPNVRKRPGPQMDEDEEEAALDVVEDLGIPDYPNIPDEDLPPLPATKAAPSDPPTPAPTPSSSSSPPTVTYTVGMTMNQAEAAVIRAAIGGTGSISAAALSLAIPKTTLWRRAKALGVDVAGRGIE